MAVHFATVLFFLMTGAVFVLAALIFGRFLRPQRKEPVKSEIYECGEPAVGSAWFNFNPRFYVVALIFVVFDVEIAFIFPVAVVFKKWMANGNGLLALIEIFLFIAILVVGLAYVWVRGDLDWLKQVKE